VNLLVNRRIRCQRDRSNVKTSDFGARGTLLLNKYLFLPEISTRTKTEIRVSGTFLSEDEITTSGTVDITIVLFTSGTAI